LEKKKEKKKKRRKCRLKRGTAKKSKGSGSVETDGRKEARGRKKKERTYMVSKRRCQVGSKTGGFGRRATDEGRKERTCLGKEGVEGNTMGRKPGGFY